MGGLSCADIGAACEGHAKANEDDAEPADGRDVLVEDEIAEKGDDCIADGGDGFDVAEVGPGEDEKIAAEKEKEGGNASPDGSAGDGLEEGASECGGGPVGDGADIFHADAEEEFTDGSEGDLKEDEGDGAEAEGFHEGKAV